MGEAVGVEVGRGEAVAVGESVGDSVGVGVRVGGRGVAVIVGVVEGGSSVGSGRMGVGWGESVCGLGGSGSVVSNVAA